MPGRGKATEEHSAHVAAALDCSGGLKTKAALKNVFTAGRSGPEVRAVVDVDGRAGVRQQFELGITARLLLGSKQRLSVEL